MNIIYTAWEGAWRNDATCVNGGGHCPCFWDSMQNCKTISLNTNKISPPIFLKKMMIIHHLPAKYLGRILPLSGPTEYFDYRFNWLSVIGAVVWLLRHVPHPFHVTPFVLSEVERGAPQVETSPSFRRTSAMYGTAVHWNHQKPAQRFGTPALQVVKCRPDKFSPIAVHQNGKETVQRCYEEHGKPHLLRIIIKNFKKVCGIKKMCYLCNPNSKAVVVKW